MRLVFPWHPFGKGESSLGCDIRLLWRFVSTTKASIELAIALFLDLLRVCMGSETIVLALISSHTNSLGISFGTKDTCRSLRVLGTGVMHAIPLSRVEFTPRVGEVTIVSRCEVGERLKDR